MCLERRHRGFAMMSAIFLLVTLAALGTFMVSFSTAQHATSAMDVQGSRAYQAARAGIEWGVYQALRNSSCAASSSMTPAGIGDFTVTVACSSTQHDEGARTVAGGNPVVLYRIVATACNPPDGGGNCPNAAATGAYYVERQVQATVAK